MRPPSRTLGVAFSDGDRTSRIAGSVVRADGTLDGLAYGSCSVGGTDATDAVIDLAGDLGREDVRHVCLAGIAPAWFNLLDLGRVHEALDRPVYAVSYEASPGLEPALREAFDGDALGDRLATYRSLPPRRRVGAAAEDHGATDHDGDVVDGDEPTDDAPASAESASASAESAPASAESAPASAGNPLFVRAVGIDDDRAATAVRALTREGFRRPEPLRIASVAASAHREALNDDDASG